MTLSSTSPHYDAIIIGSGFGGSLVAHQLIQGGLKVLMLERGDWVTRGNHNWHPSGTLDLTPHYTTETPYRILAGGQSDIMGPYSCVGGPSVFYGTVSMRFREQDFTPPAEIVGNSGAGWPYTYADLEPYYTQAETILQIAGEPGPDPTEPPRSAPYTHPLNPLSQTSQKIKQAAETLNLKPFRLPLAINYETTPQRAACIACTTCDTFACAIEAKNDLATCVLSPLLQKGLDLKANTVVTRLIRENQRIIAVECFDKQQNQWVRYHSDYFILAAGTLASPHLILASRLENLNPAGDAIGHYLMRHCNGIVLGFFPQNPNPQQQFHKQLGIQDFYFGHPSINHPPGKLGSLQQLQTPPVGLVKAYLPQPLGQLLSPLVQHLTGLLVMAEDQPQYENHVAINWENKDRFGLPQLLVTHHYTERDLAARQVLLEKGKQILRQAGAWFFYVHPIKTFSHAVGTIRMGENPQTAPVDLNGKFRGIENLAVADGSFMPTSAGINPSLTIAAHALRVGEQILKR